MSICVLSFNIAGKTNMRPTSELTRVHSCRDKCIVVSTQEDASDESGSVFVSHVCESFAATHRVVHVGSSASHVLRVLSAVNRHFTVHMAILFPTSWTSPSSLQTKPHVIRHSVTKASVVKTVKLPSGLRISFAACHFPFDKRDQSNVDAGDAALSRTISYMKKTRPHAAVVFGDLNFRGSTLSSSEAFAEFTASSAPVRSRAWTCPFKELETLRMGRQPGVCDRALVWISNPVRVRLTRLRQVGVRDPRLTSPTGSDHLPIRVHLDLEKT